MKICEIQHLIGFPQTTIWTMKGKKDLINKSVSSQEIFCLES